MGTAFIAEICLKCTKQLYYLPWRIKFDHICCFLSTNTSLPVLAAILDFWRIRLFYGYFDINFTLYECFHVKEVKCIDSKLFISTFASLPVLAAILNFSISIVFWPEVALQMCKWRIFSFSGGQNLPDRLLNMKK